MEGEVGMTVPPSVRVADHWCWEARVGTPVNSSRRPAEALGVAGVAVYPGAEAAATEVSPRDFQGFFLLGFPENV